MIEVAQKCAVNEIERTKNMQKDIDSFVLIENERDYYTVAEAAEILGVSQASVQSYITNGLLPGVSLINGRRMVSREGIQQRLARRGKSCITSFFKEAPTFRYTGEIGWWQILRMSRGLRKA